MSEAGSLFQFWGAGLYKIILLAARVTAVYNELVRLPFVCFTHRKDACIFRRKYRYIRD